MNPSIAEALNDQIRKEFNAAFLYLSFSVHMKEYGMKGAGRWLRAQYVEECGHALRLLDYMELRRISVHIPRISAPDYEWNSPLDVFRLALEHEILITQSIHALVTLCRDEEDYATQAMLMDYVKEQVEEENQITEIVDSLRRCGNDESSLLQIDMRLGEARAEVHIPWS